MSQPTSAVVIRPRFAVEAVAWTAASLVALFALDRSRHVLAIVLVAITLAVLLHAPIRALDRRLPRWAAVTTVVLASLLAVGGALALGTIQLRAQIDSVNAAVTDRIESVDPDSSLGRFLGDAGVAERVSTRLDEVPSRVLFGSPDAADGAQRGLDALLVIVLTVYALVNGRRLLRPASRDRGPWWAASLRDGVAAGASQVRRLLGVGLVSGAVGWIVATSFGLPGAGLIGIWIGVWSVVPIFGPIVGYVPMVVIASLDGTGRAVAIGVIAGVLAIAGWYLDRHVFAIRSSQSVHRLGPLGLAIALVIGLRFGWLAGPLVSILVIASAVAAIASLAERRMPARAPVEALSEGGTVWSRLAVRPTARAAGIAVLAVASIAFVIDLAPVPAWLIIGITLAVALDPLVNWIDERTPGGRGPAIATVVVGLLASVAATLVFAVPSVASSVRDLDDQLPEIATDLEQLPVVGDEIADREIAEQIQTSVEKLPDRIAADRSPIERKLRSVGDGMLATFWILLITVAGLVDGRRVRAGVRSLLPAERHDEFERVDTITRRVIARYALGSVVIALVAGSAVFVIALVAGVPLAPLLGLWAFMANFIPQIGGYLGGAPLVVMAFTLGATNGLIIAAAYLVYMQIENRIIQPVIVSKAVDIAPFVAMVGVLIGGAAAGVVGAVLVTPLIAVAKSLYTEFRTSHAESAG